MSRQEKFSAMLNAKINKIRSDFDYDALRHLAEDDGTKLSRLPDFSELAKLKNLHPALLYSKAVQLRVDRNEIEEKILIPLRRAIAALFQYQNVVGNGKSLIEGDDRPVEIMEDEAATDLFAQLLLLASNLMKYDLDPVTASGLDSEI